MLETIAELQILFQVQANCGQLLNSFDFHSVLVGMK